MTKPKAREYRIQYVDNTYQIVEWTKAEYDKVGLAMEDSKPAIKLDTEIFKLSDIRTIILLPEAETEPEQEEVNPEGQLTEWGFVDRQTAEWLRAAGIDISKGGK
jgi:hypothetical protein